MQGCIVPAMLLTQFIANAMLTASVSNAGPPGTELTLEAIAGQWHGSKDDIKITLSWDGKRQHAKLRQSYSNPSTGVGAALVPLHNEKKDTIDLRLDYYSSSKGKQSAIIATIRRDSSGTLLLSVLDKVEHLDADFRVVEDVRLKADN